MYYIYYVSNALLDASMMKVKKCMIQIRTRLQIHEKYEIYMKNVRNAHFIDYFGRATYEGL